MNTAPCPTPSRCGVATHEVGSGAQRICAHAARNVVTNVQAIRAAPPADPVDSTGRLVRITSGDDAGVVGRVTSRAGEVSRVSFVVSTRQSRGPITRELDNTMLETVDEAELPEPVEAEWVRFTLPAGVEVEGFVTDGEPDGRGLVAVEYTVQGHQFETFIHPSKLTAITP